MFNPEKKLSKDWNQEDVKSQIEALFKIASNIEPHVFLSTITSVILSCPVTLRVDAILQIGYQAAKSEATQDDLSRLNAAIKASVKVKHEENQPKHLSEREQTILSYMLENPNQPISHEQLAELIHPEGTDSRGKSEINRQLATYISRIRLVIDPKVGAITTITGVGYQYETSDFHLERIEDNRDMSELTAALFRFLAQETDFINFTAQTIKTPDMNLERMQEIFQELLAQEGGIKLNQLRATVLSYERYGTPKIAAMMGLQIETVRQYKSNFFNWFRKTYLPHIEQLANSGGDLV